MTEPTATEFALTTADEPPTLTVRVTGELDYDTSEDLVRAVVGHLAGPVVHREVCLDFAELTWIDSSGLSALLMVHRHTSAAGARLRLRNRPECLERMLHLTNVLDHLLTTPATAAAREAAGTEEDDDENSEAGAT
ncbi:STAS domain-containing protein [Streptomyces sp. NBC_00670]|jgi:anti-anti-sigma factor|uniref:STAS domain-containing protein n=1 Tax=Streptomyces sp. NBC_00670 TaxID=2975804 RepID=UPI002E3264CF|nr:STAS domain-containing protein [Streptomyces sp. NBC_00670]